MIEISDFAKVFVFNSDVHCVTDKMSFKALRVIDCMPSTHAICTSRTFAMHHPCPFLWRNVGGRGVLPHHVICIEVSVVTWNSLALFGKCQVYKNTCLE